MNKCFPRKDVLIETITCYISQQIIYGYHMYSAEVNMMLFLVQNKNCLHHAAGGFEFAFLMVVSERL